jgi:hypothetical protein
MPYATHKRRESLKDGHAHCSKSADPRCAIKPKNMTTLSSWREYEPFTPKLRASESDEWTDNSNENAKGKRRRD